MNRKLNGIGRMMVHHSDGESKMNPGNLLGALGIVRRKPAVIGAAGRYCKNRLSRSLLNGRNGYRTGPPEQVTVMVTDICNLRCEMCHYANSDDPLFRLSRVGHVKPELFSKLVVEIPKGTVVSFTGGEPLLHPQITDFIGQARSQGLLTTLTTNGWMLAKRAAALCEAGLELLVVSVDGPEETHDAVRGGKVFERLREGIEAILEHEKRPFLFVNMAISELNAGEVIHVYEMARGWGVDGINLNHLWIQTEEMVQATCQFIPSFEEREVSWALQPETLPVGQLATDLETIRRQNLFERFIVTEQPYLNRKQIATWYHEPEKFVKYDSTRCAWSKMKVWPDGEVKPCRNWSVGNIAEVAFDEVWNNQPYRDFRAMLSERGTIPICARCCHMTVR